MHTRTHPYTRAHTHLDTKDAASQPHTPVPATAGHSAHGPSGHRPQLRAANLDCTPAAMHADVRACLMSAAYSRTEIFNFCHFHRTQGVGKKLKNFHR